MIFSLYAKRVCFLLRLFEKKNFGRRGFFLIPSNFRES